MLDKIESLISAGRYFEAHNLAEVFCAENPDNLKAQQLCGLSMSKSGARLAAIQFLEPILQAHNNDAETAGILGGVYKEHFKMTADSNFARKSLETYLSNFTTTRSYYTGINAATMSQILGRGKTAKEVAAEVIDIAQHDDSFWSYATVGEAYLLLRNSTKALEFYNKAAQLGEGDYGKKGSTYAQLNILNHYINVPDAILALFAPPNVAVFAGHMIDHNRPEPRFPSEISDQIKLAITNELIRNNIKIGFTSLACGSDILFVEALLALGGEAKILIPFNREDFIQTSVAFAGDEWVERFKKIEDSQQLTYISQSNYNHDDILFQFLSKVLIGSGVMRASLFYSQPYLLTVASEKDHSLKQGGTNSLKSLWPYPQNIININPDIFVNSMGLIGNPESAMKEPVPHKNQGISKNIRYFILAKLIIDENKDAAEVEEVMLKIKAEFIEFPGNRRSGIDNDEVYAVYTKAYYAMDFALRLLGWAHGMDIQVRIGLEAALMEKGSENKETIKQTSSLKSLAFADACYATMQFATALSSEQPARYDFHHVGIISDGEIDAGQEIYKIDYKMKTALS